MPSCRNGLSAGKKEIRTNLLQNGGVNILYFSMPVTARCQTRAFLALLVHHAVFIIGIYLFFTGFFPSKLSLPGYAEPYGPVRKTQKDYQLSSTLTKLTIFLQRNGFNRFFFLGSISLLGLEPRKTRHKTVATARISKFCFVSFRTLIKDCTF